MAETPAQIIDRLLTVDLKMWNNQEMLYAIRRMSFEEFLERYEGRAGMEDLYKCLKKACDLNVQRNMLMEATDLRLIEMVRTVAMGADNEALEAAGFIQTSHKTY